MDKEFADWYQAVNIAPTTELLTNRWTAIEKYARAAKANDVLELVRIICSLAPKTADFIDTFRSVFKDADPTFLISGNTPEVKLLAGATLCEIIETNKQQANTAALALLCSDCLGVRDSEPQPLFMKRVRYYLLKQSANLRSNVPSQTLKAPDLTKIADTAAGPEIIVGLKAVGDTLKTVVGEMKTLITANQLLREESDILWWLFAGYSRDLDKAFAGFNVAAIVMLAAKELSDLVKVVPGPVSAKAILNRVLSIKNGDQKAIPMMQVIQEAPPDWLKTWAGQEKITRIGDLCPMLLSAQRIVETPTSTTWSEAIETITGIDIRKRHNPSELASQAYHEHLLMRCIPDKP